MNQDSNNIEQIIHNFQTDYKLGGCFVQDSEKSKYFETWLRTTLHHQLQKTRQDWLREEIGRLEGMKRDCCAGIGPCNEICRATNEGNHIIQTIIDRYHSELDQDTPCPNCDIHDFCSIHQPNN